MGLAVYISAKWEQREEAKRLAGILRAKGHVVTSRWWDRNGEDWQQATSSIYEIEEADVLVVLMESGYEYKGVWVELGAALALGKPVVILGVADHSTPFVSHPLVLRAGYDEDEYGFLLNVLTWLARVGIPPSLDRARYDPPGGTVPDRRGDPWPGGTYG